MVSDPADWRRDLEHWLEPFPARLSHPARRRMCPLSAAGLVGPGARKGIQPTARRRGLDGHDRPAHVVSAEAWDAAPLEAELVAQADRPVGGPDANRAIDDTALPTKGRPSVGVAPRSASAPGKSATRQTPVSMTRAKAGVPVPIALRLFLPESRTNDPARLDAAGVPEAWRAFRTEPAVAPAEIDRPIEAGLSVGIVPADAGSGPSAPFRQGLGARGLAWAVGIPRHWKVSPADVRLIFPAVGRGGPRERRVPDTPSVAAETMPADAEGRTIRWRAGTKGKLGARFAAARVGVADGPPRRIRDGGARHAPGEAARVGGEHRASGEREHCLSNPPADTDPKTLASVVKARRVRERARQRMTGELGPDPVEGRSWTGPHRHALSTMIAHAFLRHRRLSQAKRKKKGPTVHRPQPRPPAVRHAIVNPFIRAPPPPARCPRRQRSLLPSPHERHLPK